MGTDDDETCVEHVWELTGMDLVPGASMLEHQCGRCGAVTYERAAWKSGSQVS